jgi:hypothetical protein
MFIRPLMEPEDPLPCLQGLLWSLKIKYHVYRAEARGLFTVFTKPLLGQLIYYCVHRACYGARRFITALTNYLMEPEVSLPCSQGLLWSQKIHYRPHKASYRARRFTAVFTKLLTKPEHHYHVSKALLCSLCPRRTDRPVWSNRIKKFFRKLSVLCEMYWHCRLWSYDTGLSSSSLFMNAVIPPFFYLRRYSDSGA